MRHAEYAYTQLRLAAGPDPLDDVSADPTAEATYCCNVLLRREADGLTPEELVPIWRDICQTPRLASGPGHSFFRRYFEFREGSFVDAQNRWRSVLRTTRACEFLSAVIERESDDEIVALIGGLPSLLLELAHHHAEELADWAEAQEQSRRVGWLLGSIRSLIPTRLVESEAARRRLRAMSNVRAFETWRLRHYAPHPLSRGSLSVDDFAKSFVEVAFRTPVQDTRDNLRRLVSDWESEHLQHDRGALLRAVIAIERLDKRQALRGYLAAGLLENLVKTEDSAVIAMIEGEAESNAGLRSLLRGVWISGVSAPVVERLRAANNGESW